MRRSNKKINIKALDINHHVWNTLTSIYKNFCSNIMCPLCNISNRKHRSYIKAEYKIYEISLISATHSICDQSKSYNTKGLGSSLHELIFGIMLDTTQLQNSIRVTLNCLKLYPTHDVHPMAFSIQYEKILQSPHLSNPGCARGCCDLTLIIPK